jgi:16S rRNA (guanine527-N7)-methyltransferase
METSKIAELLRPFLGGRELSSQQLSGISTYIDILLRWNSRMNLTAVREAEAIVTRHFGESLFAAWNLFSEAPTPETRVVDVGSGAGFPGLPLKMFCPGIHLTLIESNQKKATFLKEVTRALTLTNVDVFSRRAEEFRAASGECVTMRAVERFEQSLPTAMRLLASGGRLALLIGESQLEQASELASALSWQKVLGVPDSVTRVLLVGTLDEPNS